MKRCEICGLEIREGIQHKEKS